MSESLTQMLGGAAAPPEVPYAGRLWKVGAPDQQAKQRLERLVKAAALEEVRQLKGVLPPAAYQEAFAEATRSLPDYRTWGPGWQRVVNDPSNAHLFLLSLLQGPQPWATEADARGMARDVPEEVRAALAQVTPGFFRTLLADLLDGLPPGERRDEAVRLGNEMLAQSLPPPPPGPPTPTPPTPSTPSGPPT